MSEVGGKEGQGEMGSSSRAEGLPQPLLWRAGRTQSLAKRSPQAEWQRGDTGRIWIFAPGSWCGCG